MMDWKVHDVVKLPSAPHSSWVWDVLLASNLLPCINDPDLYLFSV
jgi:hypothetical protein